ncbi:MAG TPA: tyrosine--tRNA ligase, partial [Acidimicrobiales bacterium]|nr:tyrosine--tRNA ligase [Acidimicrobiales bacterium]
MIEQESAHVREALDGPTISGYAGFDPSGRSLHIGNLIGIITMRRLQDGGHRPIMLAGGGTGLIGDPGGKDEERPLLSKQEHAENMAGIRGQLETLLDFSPDRGETKAILVDNADWLVKYRLVDFLRDIGKHFSVNQMMTKESVKARLDRPEQGISFTEFSYMLLQATDFLHLYENFGCRLQAGGSDQWGNITMGLELVRKAKHAEVHAFTWPLLVRSDGKKYGKSVDGAVWLARDMTSPFSLYQWFFRAPDLDAPDMLRKFTFLGQDEMSELDQLTKEHPERRAAQRALAVSVCTFVHGPEETARAERAAAALYTEEIAGLDETLLVDVVQDAPSATFPRTALDDGLPLVEALVATGLVKSKSAARTAVAQGGVYVNNKRRQEEGSLIGRDDLLHDRVVLLRRGSRDYQV